MIALPGANNTFADLKGQTLELVKSASAIDITVDTVSLWLLAFEFRAKAQQELLFGDERAAIVVGLFGFDVLLAGALALFEGLQKLWGLLFLAFDCGFGILILFPFVFFVETPDIRILPDPFAIISFRFTKNNLRPFVSAFGCRSKETRRGVAIPSVGSGNGHHEQEKNTSFRYACDRSHLEVAVLNHHDVNFISFPLSKYYVCYPM